MKIPIAWKAVFLIVVVLLVDQALKVCIKTNMALGDDIHIAGNWFIIRFVENPGMAFGWKFGGSAGKLLLSIFRMVAIVAFIWYVRLLIREKAPQGLILCIGLILAGAIGNMIDCAFYGLIFDRGTVYSPELDSFVGYSGIAKLSSDGYTSFLHGSVVDMFYFPVLKGVFPDWIPIKGGQSFEFFRPVFNIADAAVTVGGVSILLFYRFYFKKSIQSK